MTWITDGVSVPILETDMNTRYCIGTHVNDIIVAQPFVPLYPIVIKDLEGTSLKTRCEHRPSVVTAIGPTHRP